MSIRGCLVVAATVAMAFGCVVACVGSDSPYLAKDRDPSDASSTPSNDGASSSGSINAGPCHEGRRANLAAAGTAHALASDERGVYWAASAGDAGAFFEMVDIAADAGPSKMLADSPDVSFIQPQVAKVAFVQHNPDDFCWVRTYDRGAQGIDAFSDKLPASGCNSRLYAGDINAMFFGSKKAYATRVTLSRATEPKAAFDLQQTGTPVALRSDGLWLYVLFADSSYSAIWRYTFAGAAEKLVDDAGGFGPFALFRDQLVWLTPAGAVRSLPSNGGSFSEHGTISGAKQIAVGGDCVYVATNDAIMGVNPSGGWASLPIENSGGAVELSAGPRGAFWTTTTGGVEALWR